MVQQHQQGPTARMQRLSTSYGALSNITAGWSQVFSTAQGNDFNANTHDMYEAIFTVDPASGSDSPTENFYIFY